MLGTTDATATSVSGSLLTWLSFKYRKQQQQTSKLQRPLLWCRWDLPPALLWTGFSACSTLMLLGCLCWLGWSQSCTWFYYRPVVTALLELMEATVWLPLGWTPRSSRPRVPPESRALLLISYICLQGARFQFQRLLLYFHELWASTSFNGNAGENVFHLIIYILLYTV